jgi:hypothetical protein
MHNAIHTPDWKSITLAIVIALAMIGGALSLTGTSVFDVGIADACCDMGEDSESGDVVCGNSGDSRGSEGGGGSGGEGSCITQKEADDCWDAAQQDQSFGCGITNWQSYPICSTSTPSCTAPAISADISADPLLIQTGESALISWASGGVTSTFNWEGGTHEFSSGGTADYCYIYKRSSGSTHGEGGWGAGFFAQGTSGSKDSGSLTETTVFTLVCTNEKSSCTSSTASDSVTVNVLDQDALSPAADISANPPLVRSGDRSTISWTSSNTVSCEVNGGNGDGPWDGLTNNKISSPISQATTYTLNCLGANGDGVSDTATVSVETESEATIPSCGSFSEWLQAYGGGNWWAYISWCAISTLNPFDGEESGIIDYSSGDGGDGAYIPPEPSLNISARPLLVRENQTTTITWTADNVESCTVRGGNGDGPWYDESGSYDTSPIHGETTYTLTCEADDGSTPTDSVTVRIIPTWQEF